MTRALAAAARQLGHLQARPHACASTPSSQVRANHGRCSCLPACMFVALTTHHPSLLCIGVGGSSAVPPRPLGGASGGVFAGHMTPVYPAALGRPVGMGGAGATSRVREVPCCTSPKCLPVTYMCVQNPLDVPRPLTCTRTLCPTPSLPTAPGTSSVFLSAMMQAEQAAARQAQERTSSLVAGVSGPPGASAVPKPGLGGGFAGPQASPGLAPISAPRPIMGMMSPIGPGMSPMIRLQGSGPVPAGMASPMVRDLCGILQIRGSWFMSMKVDACIAGCLGC